MKLTLQQIFDLGSAITNDPNGIDSSQQSGVFNVGYLLFIEKFDKHFPNKRLKTINITKADENGNSITGLGTDTNTSTYDDFMEPYDVIEVNSDNEKLREVHEVESIWTKDKGYFCSLDKIFFPNFEVNKIFRVRYLPEPIQITAETDLSTQVFMPRKFASRFAQYLAAMQDSVEEEPNRTGSAELMFEKFFKDFGKIYNNKKPVQVDPATHSPYSEDTI